jgi:hypothetical protein
MNYRPSKSTVVVTTAIASAFEGLRAGGGTFRALLDLPARTDLGPVAFAVFSRATDLSTVGVIYYVIFGIGGAAITSVAWLIARRGEAPTLIRRLLAVSAIASLLVLVLTTQAAPLMWRVGAAPPDPALLRSLLDRFAAWTMARIVCVDVSFAAVLGALTLFALPRPGSA